LMQDVLEPPITEIGALPMNSFIKKTERRALAAALNSLLASPTFASWRQGATLDVAEWLAPRDGRTPIVIVSVAHLDDEERALVLGVFVSDARACVQLHPSAGCDRLSPVVKAAVDYLVGAFRRTLWGARLMEFLAELLEAGLVDRAGADFLAETDVDSYESLWGFLATYPGIAADRVDVTRLSTAAMHMARGVALASVPPVPPLRAHGARIPVGKTGVMRATGKRPKAPVLPGRKAIDNRSRMGSWPIKDQGKRRGTCVAFATVAALEHHHGPHSKPLELAEQYFYWALKQSVHDTDKKHDGATLLCAKDALSKDGACAETFWQYDPTYDPKNITHVGPNGPPPPARKDAKHRIRVCSDYVSAMTGKAARLYDVLKSGRVAAMTFAVYRDRPGVKLHNWNNTSAESTGRILFPPQGAVATLGHAVCVVGFVPSPSAASSGGWFVFRNSWGTGWASNGSRIAGDPGHGYLSAAYVEELGGELLAL
jgi:Papain family cysteine protease